MIAKLLPAGQVIRDTYTIVQYLGSGAFGDVYLARHRYMGLQALKLFARLEGTDALEEAYLLTRLSHPNIVRMFEANEFELEGRRLGYFSMEYVQGGTLLGLPKDTRLDRRLALGRDILQGLAFAHAQSPPIIHRDISPGNILVERLGDKMTAKISDFGLAKHVDSKSLMASAAGKFVYMSPEGFLGVHTTAADVYSAAILLFEMCSGRHPFNLALSVAATPVEVAGIVRESRVRAIPDVTDLCPSFASPWNEFFQASLAHDFEKRPANASELLRRFDSLPQPGVKSVEERKNLDEMVDEARRLSLQAETLDEAVELLESACRSSPEITSRYSELLLLWKRGIVL